MRDVLLQVGSSEGSGLDASAFRQVLALLPQAVIVTDEHHRILVVNAATARLLGYTIAELEGQNFDVLQRNPKVVYGSGASFPAVGPHLRAPWVALRRRDGTTFEAEVSAVAVQNTNGETVGYVRTILEVTDSAEAERVLHRLHQVATSPALGLEAKVERVLDLGCRYLGLDAALLCQLEGERCNVRQRSGAIEPGSKFRLTRSVRAQDLVADATVSREQIPQAPAQSSEPPQVLETARAYLGTPIVVDGERFGTLCFFGREPVRPFSPRQLALLRRMRSWIEYELTRESQNRALAVAQERLQVFATTDELTDVLNRRAFKERLDWEVRRARRKPEPFVLALADIDLFKRINDTHGHVTGDQVLRRFARLCQEVLREVDIIARWGGEEFAILLPKTNLVGARACMDRLRICLEQQQLISHEGLPFSVTVSIGAAEWNSRADGAILLQNADQALYHAKRSGRNRFMPFVSGVTPSVSQTMPAVTDPDAT